jgi:hypothetical protein
MQLHAARRRNPRRADVDAIEATAVYPLRRLSPQRKGESSVLRMLDTAVIRSVV